MNATSIKSRLAMTMAFIWMSHFLLDLMIGIWPVYKTLAHIDLAIAGLIGSVCAFAGEGLQILFGSLCDRGYRKTLILSGLVASTASTCFVYTNEHLGFLLLYLLTCIGSGAYHPSAVSLVGDLPSSRRSLLVSIYTSGGALGIAFSQLIFIYTKDIFNGHASWLALPSIILALAACFTRIINIPVDGAASKPHIDIKAFGQFFRRYDLRMLYISQICFVAIFWGTMFLLPDLLSGRGYEPWISFGGGHMMYVLGGATMMVPAGYLADRYSSRNVLMCAGVCGMVLYYIFLYSPYLNNVSVLALLFTIGAAIGVINPVAVAFGTRLAPSQKGMVSAFLMGMVWCVSECIGLGGGGFLATLFEEDAPAKALAVLGFVFSIGLYAAYQLPSDVPEAVPALADAKETMR